MFGFFGLSPIELAIIAVVVLAILIVLVSLTRRGDKD